MRAEIKMPASAGAGVRKQAVAMHVAASSVFKFFIHIA
jgi:hypothetical protein